VGGIGNKGCSRSAPHVSARLNSALFSTAPNVSVPPPPRPAAALKRSVRQFSNYSSAQVIFKGSMYVLQALMSRNTE